MWPLQVIAFCILLFIVVMQIIRNKKLCFELMRERREHLETLGSLSLLQETFDKYRSESIKLAACDLVYRGEETGIHITEEAAKQYLHMLISRHDCNYGITWEHLDYYLNQAVADGNATKFYEEEE